MSHFYGEVHGSGRTSASRQGNKESGISGHIRGWHGGAKVYMRHNHGTKRDVCDIYLTGGSAFPSNQVQVGVFKADIEPVEAIMQHNVALWENFMEMLSTFVSRTNYRKFEAEWLPGRAESYVVEKWEKFQKDISYFYNTLDLTNRTRFIRWVMYGEVRED